MPNKMASWREAPTESRKFGGKDTNDREWVDIVDKNDYRYRSEIKSKTIGL